MLRADLKARVCVNACFGFGGTVQYREALQKAKDQKYESFSVHLFRRLGRQTSFVKHLSENLLSYTVRRCGLLSLGHVCLVNEVI